MKRVIIIDNYDSFTYNIVHYIEQFADSYKVVRNNELKIKDIEKFEKILFSPGPGIPSDLQIMNKVLEKYGKTKSILGICLGHEAIAMFFGATISNLKEVSHGVGKNTLITDKTDYIFSGIPDNFVSGRYHSWVINKNSINNNIIITAMDENDNIMAIRHKTHDIRGLQFHPESIMTPVGLKIIENWVKK